MYVHERHQHNEEQNGKVERASDERKLLLLRTGQGEQGESKLGKRKVTQNKQKMYCMYVVLMFR